jgi:hypothetical protein
VSDIFHEVDEEVRREQLQKLWKRYQNLVIAGAVLILLGVAGWRGYEYLEAKKAAEMGAAFEAAMTLGTAGKHAEAEAAFGKIAAEGTSGYRTLARMRQAAELAQTDAKAAIAAYGKIAADSSVGAAMQQLAGVRAGALLVDSAEYGEARKTLEPLSGEKSPYRHTARELLALAAWRAGDTTAAKRWFDLIVTDLQTPTATRDRIEMLIALVAAENKS